MLIRLVKIALIILGAIGMYFSMVFTHFTLTWGDEAWDAGESDMSMVYYGLAFGAQFLTALYWFALGRIKKRNLPSFE